MDAEEQLRKLKQTPPVTKEEKRRKLTTAITLALATLLSVLFLVYAFVKKLEADALRIEAQEQRVEAEKQREEAVKQRLTAEYSRHAAELVREEAEKQSLLAHEALENCRKSKR